MIKFLTDTNVLVRFAFFEPGLFSFSGTLKTFSSEQMLVGFRSRETLKKKRKRFVKMWLMDAMGTLYKAPLV